MPVYVYILFNIYVVHVRYINRLRIDPAGLGQRKENMWLKEIGEYDDQDVT
jgi:hypothetical protein